MKAWIKRNPNKCGVILWGIYSWAKAVAAARFGYQVMPETDMLFLTVLSTLGLYSTTRPNPPAQ